MTNFEFNEKEHRYILVLSDGGSYFGDTLWGLFKEVISHRYWHWKRGDGWVD